MNARNRCVGCVFVMSGLAIAGSAWGGSLAPPPGPIQSTSRTTLSQTLTPLPYTITQPGSYVLTSNLVGSAAADGIMIAAQDVTIDLNGFVIDGAGATGNGNVLALPVPNVTVKNGSVRGWGNTGVQLEAGLGSSGYHVEGLTVQDCGTGIQLSFGTVERCTVQQNQFTGLVARRSVVEHCIAYQNGADGIDLLETSKARDCTSSENQSLGMLVGISSEAEGCTAQANTAGGFIVDGAGIARGCIASGNTNDGFQVIGAQAIECSSEGSANDGFFVDGGVVRQCKAVANQNDGIEALDNALIVDNQSTFNTGYGIATMGTNTRVSGNSCHRNTGDNFYLNGSVNSIYSNSATLSLAGVNYNLVTPLNDVAPISSAAAATSPVGNISY